MSHKFPKTHGGIHGIIYVQRALRENARRTSCTSSLKQLILAVAQYEQDADETMPLVLGNAPINSKPGNWIWYTNAVFAMSDGHAKYYLSTQIPTPTWPEPTRAASFRPLSASKNSLSSLTDGRLFSWPGAKSHLPRL